MLASISSPLDMLKTTSKSFYAPICLLPPELKEAATAAYLCMRAIDQIEDHPTLDAAVKARLLRQISLNLQTGTELSTVEDFTEGLRGFEDQLEEVTLRVGEWALMAPSTISPRIWDAAAAMADRMAYWAERNWLIQTESDLNHYTFSVSGAVGLLLSDLWAWYDGTQTSRMEAICFGRGLQSVNILSSRIEDLQRGVDFFPDGWTTEDMKRYSRHHLGLAEAYIKALPKGPALAFCRMPLALALSSLEALP